MVVGVMVMGALGEIVVPVPSVATIFAAVAEHRPTVVAGTPFINAILGTTDSVCVAVVLTNVFLVAVTMMLNGGAVADAFFKKNDAKRSNLTAGERRCGTVAVLPL